MKVIGLTGGIGSGKSTVAGFLEKLGARWLDLDKTGHAVLREDEDVRNNLVEAFGDVILGEDGHIDRNRLSEKVFNDAAALDRLNSIIHGAIDKRVFSFLDEARADGSGVVVLDAPVLIESGRAIPIDEVWVTAASEDAVIRRVMGRSGLKEADIKARIRSQMPVGEKAEKADVVIDTDCSLEELERRTGAEWDRLQQRLAE